MRLEVDPDSRIVAQLSDRLAMQIINSEFSKLKLPDGTRWVWLVFGSEGRHEQTLLTDQDNGLVFSLPAGADLEATRRVFLDAAKQINEDLAVCGYFLCSGGIMAGNPPCCLSVDEWRQEFRNFRTDGDGMIDIKHGAVAIFVDAARFFHAVICNRCKASATPTTCVQ